MNKLSIVLLHTVLILSCAVSVSAQDMIWNDLNKKAAALFQERRYSEAVKVAAMAQAFNKKIAIICLYYKFTLFFIFDYQNRMPCLLGT